MTYSKPQLTKALRRLNEGNMTATEKATRGIIITILNYDTYQDPKNYEGNDEGSTKEQRRNFGGNTINKNEKNDKKDNIKTIPPLRKSFDLFWSTYPKKKSKGQAEKIWNRIKPNEQLVAIMIAKIKQAMTSEDWLKNNGQFIPHPATWLNAKGWEDEGYQENIKTKTTIFKVDNYE